MRTPCLPDYPCKTKEIRSVKKKDLREGGGCAGSAGGREGLLGDAVGTLGLRIGKLK